MSKKSSKDAPARLSVTITLEDQADFDLLDSQAKEAGKPRSTHARELLLQALHFDEREAQLAALQQVEARLEKLQRNSARGTWMVLRAMEQRAAGEPVADSREWVRETILSDL